MASELAGIKAWLYGLLSGYAVGVAERVYDAPAPQGSTFPLVTFQYLDGSDVMGVSTARVMTTGTWLVRGITRSESYGDLTAIADAIDSLLHGSHGDGANILGAVRERPFELTEVFDGVKYVHLGGIYRIYSQ